LTYKKYNYFSTKTKDQKRAVDPYYFVDYLSGELNNDDVIVVDGGGAAMYMSFQAFRVKQGQRLILSSGICAMGTGLPESIGACFANGKKRTICLCGDGSMQFNIHELQTIMHHKLPIKIFVFNNEGYLAIRHTQNGFLKGNYVGSDEKGGVSLPDFLKVAKAYGINGVRVHNNKELKEKVRLTLNKPGPMLCEIMISRDQQLIPQIGFDKNPDGTASSRPLEDMFPYLDRKEFMENMIVKPLASRKQQGE
jgi:acetolactate synthase-1/2/3 large subunit